MVRRCLDPRRKDFKSYGAHGITVCDAWRGTVAKNEWNHDGFENFKKWALSHGYRDGMTLDRMNNNTGYRPENCRWISKKAQAYNRQTNRYINIDGHTKTLTEWCEIYGITADVVIHRIQKGWEPERAIKTPKRAYRK